MFIGGIQKNSFIDYPGKIAAVLFARGCNFRCPYCHNPELLGGGGETLAVEEVFDFLEKRQGRLQGVVVSGGEPTVHPDLPEFVARLKSLGYAVKLDTNGSNPAMLEEMICSGLLDYIAMDLKTAIQDYPGKLAPGLCGTKLGEKLLASMRLMASSGLPGEFRTTCAAPFITEAHIERIALAICENAPELPWWLQRANGEGSLEPASFCAVAEPDLARLRELALRHVRHCEIR